MITKIQTGCCALCQLSVTNDTTLQELDDVICQLRLDAFKKDWSPSDRTGGETAIFVITAPGEDKLVRTLRMAGFMSDFFFKRRKGYPEGTLKMWTYAF
jgi:hypothetical protein